MPKAKSKSAVKKRFRISKNGKAMCSHPDRGHGHAPFNGKVRRRLRSRNLDAASDNYRTGRQAGQKKDCESQLRSHRR